MLSADLCWTQLCDNRLIVEYVPVLCSYERRVMELLKNSKDKRARKLAKKRVRSCDLVLVDDIGLPSRQ